MKLWKEGYNDANDSSGFYDSEAESVIEHYIHTGYGFCHHHDYGYRDYLANEICWSGTGSEPEPLSLFLCYACTGKGE